jgi:hypothetical protein
MTANSKAGPANTPLHERMAARGAKKHRRKSSLARFMIERAAEMHRLVDIDRYSWKDIAAMLAEDEGLTDNNGNPVSETVARLTWSRVKPGHTPKPTPSQRPATPALAQPEENTLQIAHAPFANPAPAPMPIDIRPASLRRDSTAPVAKAPEIPGVTLLSDAEVQQQIDELAARQGGRKIPPAQVL